MKDIPTRNVLAFVSTEQKRASYHKGALKRATLRRTLETC